MRLGGEPSSIGSRPEAPPSPHAYPDTVELGSGFRPERSARQPGQPLPRAAPLARPPKTCPSNRPAPIPSGAEKASLMNATRPRPTASPAHPTSVPQTPKTLERTQLPAVSLRVSPNARTKLDHVCARPDHKLYAHDHVYPARATPILLPLSIAIVSGASPLLPLSRLRERGLGGEGCCSRHRASDPL